MVALQDHHGGVTVVVVVVDVVAVAAAAAVVDRAFVDYVVVEALVIRVYVVVEVVNVVDLGTDE